MSTDRKQYVQQVFHQYYRLAEMILWPFNALQCNGQEGDIKEIALNVFRDAFRDSDIAIVEYRDLENALQRSRRMTNGTKILLFASDHIPIALESSNPLMQVTSNISQLDILNTTPGSSLSVFSDSPRNVVEKAIEFAARHFQDPCKK